MAKCTGVRCPMQHGYKVEECNQSDCPYRTEPITNADRIRAMSDEELADWLARTQIDNIAEALKIAGIPWEQHPDLRELTAKDNLEWLKQPAEVI